jgi:hypothetical protein
MARGLQSYHYAWLGSHPGRTEKWLRGMLKTGFQIHHLDHNHYNDDPANLVLMEGSDHFRVHGFIKMSEVLAKGKKLGAKRKLERARLKYAAALPPPAPEPYVEPPKPKKKNGECWFRETRKQSNTPSS